MIAFEGPLAEPGGTLRLVAPANEQSAVAASPVNGSTITQMAVHRGASYDKLAPGIPGREGTAATRARMPKIIL